MKTLAGILILSVVLGLAWEVKAAPVLFLVPLEGSQEVPGPGDSDGTGTAFLAIDPDALTIDWDITVHNIVFPLTGAHIHEAPAGVAGPIVVDFDRQLSGAGLADPDLAAVLANPANYYVNLHNRPFPEGAIRGQLGTPIPDPSTLSLVVIGLVSLGLSRRRLSAQERKGET